MAFGGGRGGRRVKSDINVTPLVDVVLVLLIIFIVAIPVVMRDLLLDIPKQAEPDSFPESQVEPLIVQLKGDGTVLLTTGFADPETVLRTELAAKLHAKLDRILAKDRIVFVDFEDTVIYGDAVSLMDTVKGSGAETVGLKMREAVATAP